MSPALKILGSLTIVYALGSAARMSVLIQRGKKVAATAVPFQRRVPGATTRILIAGDSTAVGTGASRPEESVAGRFGSDYPNSEIVNVSRNGKRVHELLAELQNKPLGTFQLVVFQIGANDIVYLTPMDSLRRDLDALLKHAAGLSPTVLILHSGNLGASPLFPWPVSAFYTARTRRVRSLYQELAAKNNAHYVDLFQERDRDIFLRDPKRYYLTDLYHPSSDGYGIWYNRIRATLDTTGWKQ